MRFLPPSKITACDLDRALLTEGCIISASSIRSSIVGVRARVGEGTTLENTIVMGADYYDPPELPPGILPLGIGRNCVIRNAIVDKNARIGDGCVITPDGKPDGHHPLYTVADGIIVIPKNTSIPPGTHL
jgi:glucose-1-phosphate adenylyltransferase